MKPEVLIAQLAKEIADLFFPPIKIGNGNLSVQSNENDLFAGLLLAFAKEIKRASIEGEW